MDNQRAIELKTWGDPGLYLVEKFWVADARIKIAAQMEYRNDTPA